MRLWKKYRPIWIILIAVVSVILCLTITFFAFVGNYYEAEEYAVECLVSDEEVEITEKKNYIELKPTMEYDTAILFYPGAKVDQAAYVPLFKELARNGILCIIVEMPFHMAVLDSNAAKDIMPKYTEIKHWYMAGHSLGGAMMSNYVSKHPKSVEGLILLAAYSTEKLPDIKVLSIYGDEDKVLNKKAYEENKRNLPEDTKEVIIKGGCHAYFGYYGIQKKDGTPNISISIQQEITKEEILKFIYM